MASSFNESTVSAEPIGKGGRRQRLLSRERLPQTNILLDRISIEGKGQIDLEVLPNDIGWFQMLSGTAVLTIGTERTSITDGHVVFLPPGTRASMSSAAGASLLYAVVPDAQRFDKTLSSRAPAFRAIDWRHEPVLDSQHDARKRIYLVTPKMFGTKVLKGEMIIYPAGTMAANHHHEGAEHFMYITRGRGTAWASEKPFPVRAGDVVYYADRERHYLKADDDSELVFSEFFVPGEYATIWVNENEVCTWLPTGRDIRGEKPVREIKAHSSADFASPSDV